MSDYIDTRPAPFWGEIDEYTRMLRFRLQGGNLSSLERDAMEDMEQRFRLGPEPTPKPKPKPLTIADNHPPVGTKSDGSESDGVVARDAEYKSRSGRFEQLRQLSRATWDGNLISKVARDELVKVGYVERACGWNMITKAGLEVLVGIGELKA